MRIATWNVERLKNRRSLCDILLACEQARADILILTETDEQVRPSSFRYCFQTPKLMEIAPGYYKPTENRVSILTNYKCVSEHITYDKYTALCVELETELGYLCVYGTIMGIEGNRRPSFKADLQKQIEDFARLTDAGKISALLAITTSVFRTTTISQTLGGTRSLSHFQKTIYVCSHKMPRNVLTILLSPISLSIVCR